MSTHTTRTSGTGPTADGTRAADPAGEPVGGATPRVVVRYWAAARAATGVERDEQPGGSVGAVVDAAVAAHPELARVARAATFLVDGRAAARDTPVTAGSTVEVLPPFAGG